MSRIQNLSFWAARHPWQARLAIAALMIVLHLLGLQLADLISQTDATLPAAFFPAVLLITAACVLCYPSRWNHRAIRHRYLRQKACDFMLAACTFCAVVSFATNVREERADVLFGQEASASRAPHLLQKGAKAAADGFSALRAKAKLAVLKAAARRADGGQGGWIALVIFGAVVVCLGIAVLACVLACSGAEVVAILLLVIGIPAVIYGSVRLVRMIKRNNSVGPRRRD